MWKRYLVVAVALVSQIVPTSAWAGDPPFGIETRAENTSLLLTTPPNNLSENAALLAAGQGEDQSSLGIFPYRPSTELWSDGALKSRFIALPGLATLAYTADGGWDFPDGTILIKNFSLPLDFRTPDTSAQRIETRLMVKQAGAWSAYSYEWNEAETDAALVGSDGATRAFSLTGADGAPLAYEWYYPSVSDCFRCHNEAANVVLGINTAQMNHDFLYPSGVTDNQLRTFEHLGLFDAPLPAAITSLPASPDAKHDLGASLKDRALAYVHANCAICHRPEGPTPANMDLRWGQALEARNLINVEPTGSTLGLPNPFRIASGDPDNSVLLERMSRRDQHQMPPLGTSLVDEEAVALIREWIVSLAAEDTVTADQDGDYVISLSELLRVIQFYNSLGLHCEAGTEDGFAPGAVGDQSCTPHSTDYAPQDWAISLSELLRVIQFYNALGYRACPDEATEDGFCPGLA